MIESTWFDEDFQRPLKCFNFGACASLNTSNIFSVYDNYYSIPETNNLSPLHLCLMYLILMWTTQQQSRSNCSRCRTRDDRALIIFHYKMANFPEFFFLILFSFVPNYNNVWGESINPTIFQSKDVRLHTAIDTFSSCKYKDSVEIV